jgi:hypothetical protein
MKTRIKIGLFGLLLLISTLLAEATVKSFNAEATPASAIEKNYGGRFVIGAYEGNIAVYMNGAPSPQTVTDIELQTLPQLDRLAIESGIEVGSYDELLMRLEDYGK